MQLDTVMFKILFLVHLYILSIQNQICLPLFSEQRDTT